MLTNLMEKGFSAGVVGMAAEAVGVIIGRSIRAGRIVRRLLVWKVLKAGPARPRARSLSLYSFGSFVSPGSVKPIARFAPIKVLLATSSAASDPSRSTC